jgi:hypothetical protein
LQQQQDNPVTRAISQQLIKDVSQRGSPGTIEGYVYLKRKQDWVKRYAQVDNSVFSYKK